MTKGKVVSIVLALLGVACLGLAGYFYWTMQSMLDTFAYYGVSENSVMDHPESSRAIWNLRFGVIQFVIGGIALFTASVFVFIRTKRRNG